MKKKELHNVVFDFSVAGATKGGVYVFAKNLIEELRKTNQISVQVFCTPFSSVGKKGLFRKINSLLRLFYRELIIIKQRKKTIFFFPAPEVPLLFLLLRKRNFIITIHDLYAWKNKRETTFYARLSQRVLPMLSRRALRIFTVSKFSKEDIVRYFKIPEDKVCVINNGLNELFLSAKGTPSEERRRYLLNVGALEPRKNIPFLVDIFNELKKRGLEDLKLLLTGGESWKEGDIFDKIEQSPYKKDIEILKYVPTEALPQLYRNAEAFIFPSYEEGFGIPVIESISQGTPVFVNKNSALQYFNDYGATVIDGYDLKIWADAIAHCVQNKVRVGKQYVDKVKQVYTWSNAAQSFISEINDIKSNK